MMSNRLVFNDHNPRLRYSPRKILVVGLASRLCST